MNEITKQDESQASTDSEHSSRKEEVMNRVSDIKESSMHEVTSTQEHTMSMKDTTVTKANKLKEASKVKANALSTKTKQSGWFKNLRHHVDSYIVATVVEHVEVSEESQLKPKDSEWLLCDFTK